jgi:sugar phosphate isomerase/epimerase
MNSLSRRQFLSHAAAAGMLAASPLVNSAYGIGPRRAVQAAPAAVVPPVPAIRFGLVTYQWAQDWDLPTLIANCKQTGVLGVELRTSHAHKVEPDLNAQQRQEVRKRFADSPVTLVGLGTADNLHYPEPEKHKQTLESVKAFIKLSHDVGGSGVKVRPNDLPKGIAPEKTIAQIGKALNELGAFGLDYGQQIRLEVHGGCARLPIIRQIMDIATHPNVGVCWNSNKQDLEAPGLEYNFNLVKARLGATAHVRTFTSPDYPWPDLIRLFVKANYHGWLLLEAGTKVPDRVAALAEQARMFRDLLAKAQK